MTPEQLKHATTTDGKPPRPGYEHASAPAPVNSKTGQHEAYWVLSEAEHAKGFVRPVRKSYRHVGCRPRYPLRDLTAKEQVDYANEGYAKYEAYPESELPALGKFWTQRELASGCGTVTTMGLALAETYARQPSFYGSTFCVHCSGHFPVGQQGEFIWLTDDGRDTTEKVGT